jgi:hypothetical protein
MKRKALFPLTSPVVSDVEAPLLSTFRTVSILSAGDLLRKNSKQLSHPKKTEGSQPGSCGDSCITRMCTTIAKIFTFRTL